jgi:hypothetical protein
MKSKLLCYHDPKFITTVDFVSYFCADKDGVVHFNGDAVINFTGHANVPQLSHIPSLASHVDVPYEELVITWPDFGLPKVKPTFWKALHEYIKSRSWDKVCLHCEGGHGRTGTAMASILMATQMWPMDKAVAFVRNKYCIKAVETHSQIDYLCDLSLLFTGESVDERRIPQASGFMEQTKKGKGNVQSILSKYFIKQEVEEEERELDQEMYMKLFG